MSNERLRAAMTAAGLDIEGVAGHVDVDPKTVERWLRGRLPHRRHRMVVAGLLGEEEPYLWPKQRELDLEAGEADTSAEIVGAWAHRASAPLELWRGLLERCSGHIDAIGYAMLFLPEQQPDLVEQVAARCAAGCRLRIAVADPEGEQTRIRDRLEGLDGTLPARIRTTMKHLQPLRDIEGMELRLHDQHLYSATYRFDDEMVVTPYLVAAHGYQHPLLHLRRLGPYGLFAAYMGQFERLWADARPIDQPEREAALS